MRKDWNDGMLRKPAPKKGCFTADYPSTEWKEVRCVKAPNIPAPPRHGPRTAVVGNNNDVSAGAPSGHITQAIGHSTSSLHVSGDTRTRNGIPGKPLTIIFRLRFREGFRLYDLRATLP